MRDRGRDIDTKIREREIQTARQTDRKEYKREGGEFAGGTERSTQIQKSEGERGVVRVPSLCIILMFVSGQARAVARSLHPLRARQVHRGVGSQQGDP